MMWLFIRIGACIGFFFGLGGCQAPFDPGEGYASGAREVSIHYLKSLYRNTPLRITEDLVITGRVVSSDKEGNFRWSLIVEDETGGIELKIGLSPYYEKFPAGCKVRIKCAGLVLGAYGRTIQLGAVSSDPAYETGFIAQERLGEFISLSQENVAEEATVLGAGAITMRHVNCAVRVQGVRFIEEEQGLTWGDGIHYVERHLQFLSNPSDTLSVRTSPDAVFAGRTLPTGSGDLEGVLTQFAGKLALVLNGVQRFE